MTIGIVSSVFGPKYYGFVLGWSEALAGLETKPHMITVIHDGIPDQIRSAAEEYINLSWVYKNRGDVLHPQVHVNDVIGITDTEWIIKADIDDRLLPHALNGIDSNPADIVNFGYRIGDNQFPSRPVTAERILEKENNPVGSCSPFRKTVWENNRFQDLFFDDWAFWIGAARGGAIFDHTGRVDYVYSVHPEQISHKINSSIAHEQIRSL